MKKSKPAKHSDRAENLLNDSERDISHAVGYDEDFNKEEQAREMTSVPVFMWEFGQNDPKRDSGSKLCRLGLAKVIKVGQTFGGLVLSSETNIYISAADKETLQTYGISGINCSWNRLEEIPFTKLGKPRNQRVLPILYAANSVNYGRPYKLNTAEATAAALYICGFKNDARIVMDTFSYGPEFLRLNQQLLEAYSNCDSSEQVLATEKRYLEAEKAFKESKQKKIEDRAIAASYIDESDLPPQNSDDDYEEEEELPINDLKKPGNATDRI